MTVVKRDADSGEPVADTVFLVEGADGHSVDEIRTGPDGTAVLENLLPGVYEISEKSVPSPYLMDAEPQLVTLYPNQDHTVYFENHKRPTVTVQKENSITHDPIQYAEFHITWASKMCIRDRRSSRPSGPKAPATPPLSDLFVSVNWRPRRTTAGCSASNSRSGRKTPRSDNP